jgi:hypothetical protein
MLESSGAERGEVLWDGRECSSAAQEHEWYSRELDRLKRAYALSEEDAMDAEAALAQAKAMYAAVQEQAQHAHGMLEAFEKESKASVVSADAVRLERELMRLQQETISTERTWEDARTSVALPLINELASVQGADVLQADADANRAKQERRIASQRHALQLLRMHAARLDVLELAMAAELEAHMKLAGVVRAVTHELRSLADAKKRVCERAARALEREPGALLSAAPSTDLLLPYHVALGGKEEGVSRAFLSMEMLSSEARALHAAHQHAEASLSAAVRAHEGETRALEKHIKAYNQVLWAQGTESLPICTATELQKALSRLDKVKVELDDVLDSALREREAVQARAGSERALFADFFNRPDAFVEAMQQFKREAGCAAPPSRARV